MRRVFMRLSIAASIGLVVSPSAAFEQVFAPDGEPLVTRRGRSPDGDGVTGPGPGLHGPFPTNDRSGALLFVSHPHLSAGEPGTLRLIFTHFNELRFSMSRDGGYSWPIESRMLQNHVDFYGVRNSNLARVSSDSWAVMWTERNPDDFARETRVAHLDSLGHRTGPSRLARRIHGDDPRLASLGLEALSSSDALVATWVELRSGFHGQAMSATSFGDSLDLDEPRLIAETAAAPAGGPVTHAFGDVVLAAMLTLSDAYHLDLYHAEPAGEWSLLHRFILPPGFEHEGRMSIASTNGIIGLSAIVDPGSPPLEVWFWESSDGGITWRDPVTVSADAPVGNHFDSYLAADPLGGWHCAWLHNTPALFDVDVLYARRDPDTRAWSSATRVNRETGDVGVSVGQTLSIAADADGHAYIAYSELVDDQTFWLVTTRPRPWDGLDGTDWYVVQPASLAGASARVRFSTPDPARITTTVFDVRGRRVMRWPAETFGRGIHTREWNGTTMYGARAGSGVYFWCFDYEIGTGVRREMARTVVIR